MFKVILLTIIFTTSNGDKALVDGWHPREQPSMEVCEQRKAFMIERMEEVYMPMGLNNTVHPLVKKYEVTCVEIDIPTI